MAHSVFLRLKVTISSVVRLLYAAALVLAAPLAVGATAAPARLQRLGANDKLTDIVLPFDGTIGNLDADPDTAGADVAYLNLLTLITSR